MTIATKIAEDFNSDFAGGLEKADKLAEDRDQDWDNEATTFTFEDGSKLRCSYPTLEVVQ